MPCQTNLSHLDKADIAFATYSSIAIQNDCKRLEQRFSDMMLTTTALLFQYALPYLLPQLTRLAELAAGTCRADSSQSALCCSCLSWHCSAPLCAPCHSRCGRSKLLTAAQRPSLRRLAGSDSREAEHHRLFHFLSENPVVRSGHHLIVS